MFISKYEDTMDNCDRICPYCGDSYQVEGEDVSEDTREDECDECGKKFYAHDGITVTHHARPDCELNGRAHQWESADVGKGFHDFCSVCGKCRPFSE